MTAQPPSPPGMTRHEGFVPGIIDEDDEVLIGDGLRPPS
jgi:hypothetical protein